MYFVNCIIIKYIYKCGLLWKNTNLYNYRKIAEKHKQRKKKIKKKKVYKELENN